MSGTPVIWAEALTVIIAAPVAIAIQIAPRIVISLAAVLEIQHTSAESTRWSSSAQSEVRRMVIVPDDRTADRRKRQSLSECRDG
jgi:hypothetical protein